MLQLKSCKQRVFEITENNNTVDIYSYKHQALSEMDNYQIFNSFFISYATLLLFWYGTKQARIIYINIKCENKEIN